MTKAQQAKLDAYRLMKYEQALKVISRFTSVDGATSDAVIKIALDALNRVDDEKKAGI